MVSLLKRLYNTIIQSVSEEDKNHIIDEIREANRIALAIYSTICAFFMFVLVVLSSFLSDFSSFQWLYIGSSIALFLISFSAWKLLPGKLILVEPAIIIIILNTFGIYLGTIQHQRQLNT